MKTNSCISSVRLPWIAILFGSLVLPLISFAAVQIIGVQHQQDQFFPEDNCIWHDRQYPGPCSSAVFTGQVVKVFLKNTGSSSVTINDATLAGWSLNQVLAERYVSEVNRPRSIYYANLSSSALQSLLNAGEPVWYKANPRTIPAGGAAQVVVRLRQRSLTLPISIGVSTSAGSVLTNVVPDATGPQLVSVGFSADRRTVYLHWRRPDGNAAPVAVLMDGSDVTAQATSVGDPALDFGVTVLSFQNPLANMSFHVYQGVFADGKRATGGVWTWVNPFLYGTWGARPTDPGAEAGKTWVNEATAHGANVVVMNVNSDGLSDLMASPSGRAWMNERNYGKVKDEVWDADEILRMWFIRDEPDGADANMPGLPAGLGHNPGVLAMQAIERGETLRAAKSDVPVSVNIDGNLKPYNYWNWGQVPDVFMVDPYYQPLLAHAYWYYPNQIPLYSKATMVYATARTAALAAEPNPLHVILYSCKQQNPDTGQIWPFAPPGTKRIEAYYALAGGAKGMAYWWFKLPDGLAYGDAAANALWKEIGLIGNEIKTLQPLLVISHPVSLPMSGTSGIWARALAAGQDALILLLVNDNHVNNSSGFSYTPIANATLDVTLPAWLPAAEAFEVRPSGLYDVATTLNGSQLQLNLGTLQITKLIVLTTNAQLRSDLQTRYVTQVWPNVCAIAPEHCLPQNAPPSISVQPASRTVALGGTATFSVVASGTSPLWYQWQKFGTNLSDGGHYSGATTPTLTIASADLADEGPYRCIITNSYGAVTSSIASLTVSTNVCGFVENPGFENGFTLYGGSYIGNYWTQWSSAPNTITGYDETSVIHGGAHAQRIRVWNTNGGTTYAGIYQRVAVTAGMRYTNSVWMYAYDTNSYCYLGVDPTGGTNPNSANIVWSSGYNGVAWTRRTWTGVAQSNYLTIFLRVRSTDKNKRNGYFDDVTLSCAGGFPPTILVSPTDQTVVAGDAITFGVQATGTEPLSYQWQKNGLNLTNDGRLFGTTSPELEINNAMLSDAGSYRCIIANAYGSVTSSPAALTVLLDCQPSRFMNGDFEEGFTGGVGNGWTTYVRNGGGGIWSAQTAGAPQGTYYQQIQLTNTIGGAGVRQNILGTVPGATYQISGWMRGNSSAAYYQVRVSPSASTDWNTAVALSPAQSGNGSTWVAFSGTVVATGTNMTLWLDGRVTTAGKAVAFDGVSVTCVSLPNGVATPLQIEAAAMVAPGQFRLRASGPAGGTLTIERSSNLVDWEAIATVPNEYGTIEFTDTALNDATATFYRVRQP